MSWGIPCTRYWEYKSYLAFAFTVYSLVWVGQDTVNRNEGISEYQVVRCEMMRKLENENWVAADIGPCEPKL